MTELELETRYFWSVAKVINDAVRLEVLGVASEGAEELEAIEMHAASGLLRRAARRAIEGLAPGIGKRSPSPPGCVVRPPFVRQTAAARKI